MMSHQESGLESVNHPPYSSGDGLSSLVNSVGRLVPLVVERHLSHFYAAASPYDYYF